MKAIHEWSPCFRQGKAGELVAVTALNQLPDWRIERQSTSKSEQGDLGFDYVGKFGVHRGGIEIKTDMRSRESKRLAIELQHEDPCGGVRDGWSKTTAAAFVLFLSTTKDAVAKVESMVQSGNFDCGPMADGISTLDDGAALYVLDVSAMRRAIPQWRETARMCAAQNKGYVTWSILPSIAQLGDALVVRYSIRFGIDRVRRRICSEANKPPVQMDLFGGPE